MKQYLFSGTHVFTDKAATATFALNPVQPYLAHHKVNKPLFGTCMSIEAMAYTAQLLRPDMPLSWVGDVRFGDECFVTGSEPCEVTGTAEIGDENEIIHTTFIDGQQLFFEANMEFAERRQKRRNVPRHLSDEVPTVEKSEIYSLFFHGPAFQVVERAQYNGTELIACMGTSLPKLSDTGTLTVSEPLLLEFCMQSAGLFLVAAKGLMQIPKGIASVTYFDIPKQEQEIIAIVRQEKTDICIDAVDRDGNLCLAVRGYCTAPLFKNADSQPAQCLSALFFK